MKNIYILNIFKLNLKLILYYYILLLPFYRKPPSTGQPPLDRLRQPPSGDLIPKLNSKGKGKATADRRKVGRRGEVK